MNWRKRMQDLARGAGLAHEPLFAPLLYGVAAQIEAIEPLRMARDGTRLRKNLAELRRIVRADALACAVPSALELEALGVATDDGTWPPRPVGRLRVPDSAEVDPGAMATSPRLAAALDAVRQLGADTEPPLIVAALTGPATLVAQFRSAGCVLDDESIHDLAGRTAAAMARLFAEAGVHVLQWHESVPPGADQVDAWKGALSTAANVARFHRVPPLLVADFEGAATWPAQAVAAPTHAQHPGAMARPHARAWLADPNTWPALPASGERLVTTVAEVPPAFDIAALKSQVEHVRGSA